MSTRRTIELVECESALDAIGALVTEIERVWSHTGGWAPESVTAILAESRLDWLASLGRSLRQRVQELAADPHAPGALIIAWANLRALVEGYLMLYLSVHLADYEGDPNAPSWKGVIVGPPELKLERLRQFVEKRDLLSAHHDLILIAQRRGNAIHAFSARDLGVAAEFVEALPSFLAFLQDVAASLPEPPTSRWPTDLPAPRR